MIFGNLSKTVKIGQNVGINVSFVEGAQKLISFGSGWVVKGITSARAFAQSFNTEKTCVVWWGDGTHTIIAPGNSEKVYHTYGIPKPRRVIIFGGSAYGE